jgi:hypothetical protein
VTQPPSLPKFCCYITDGKTKGRWVYFRTKETGHIRLRGAPGSSEFHAAYSEALALRERIRAGDTLSARDPASLAWLVDRYLTSVEFKALADPTQADYSRTCATLAGQLGDQPFRFITRAMIKAVRDDLGATPRKANKLQQMASSLYSWAQQASLVPDGCNPARGLKR